VFVVKAVMPDIRLAGIFSGVTPFIGALLTALLIFLMPGIATFLPRFMG
jgi:TRAP-type C4-dicarboxylate transport system permease large subunit